MTEENWISNWSRMRMWLVCSSSILWKICWTYLVLSYVKSLHAIMDRSSYSVYTREWWNCIYSQIIEFLIRMHLAGTTRVEDKLFSPALGAWNIHLKASHHKNYIEKVPKRMSSNIRIEVGVTILEDDGINQARENYIMLMNSN